MKNYHLTSDLHHRHSPYHPGLGPNICSWDLDQGRALVNLSILQSLQPMVGKGWGVCVGACWAKELMCWFWDNPSSFSGLNISSAEAWQGQEEKRVIFLYSLSLTIWTPLVVVVAAWLSVAFVYLLISYRGKSAQPLLGLLTPTSCWWGNLCQ